MAPISFHSRSARNIRIAKAPFFTFLGYIKETSKDVLHQQRSKFIPWVRRHCVSTFTISRTGQRTVHFRVLEPGLFLFSFSRRQNYPNYKSAIFYLFRSKVRRYCISTRGSWIHILVLANQIRPPDLLVLLSANQINATDHMTPFLQSDSST